MKNTYFNYIRGLGLIVILSNMLSCKKVIEVEPPINKKTSEQIFSNTTSAVSAVTGLYDMMANDKFSGLTAGDRGLSFQLGLLSDELEVSEGHPYFYVYQNNIQARLNSTEGEFNWFWNNAFGKFIYRTNSCIDGVAASKGIPEPQKKILIGECKFLRAYFNFMLINLYGSIPLVLTRDFEENAVIPRSSENIVYDQIISDLKEAQDLLPKNYVGVNLVSTTEERIRPNYFTATALLARVYLYTKLWAEAETESSKILNTSMYQLVSLNEVFLMNSKEAIWQLQPNPLKEGGSQQNTLDAILFLSTQIRASKFLLNEFEPNDQRRTKWIGDLLLNVVPTPYINKYKSGGIIGSPEIQQEYTMVFRLAEQYLIRAEARANLNKITGSNSASEDLDMIRERAGLGENNINDQASMLDAIYHERYVEFFSELGHRWFDLKRTGKINARMNEVIGYKGGTWSVYKSLLPIPLDEFKYNPSLIGHQNPGYIER